MHRLLLSGALMMVLALGSTPAAQSAKCPPPPEWGATKAFGAWRVGRACTLGIDTLSVAAASEAGPDRAFTFLCDEDGPGGLLTFNKIDVSGPVALTIKGGSAPALDAVGSGLIGGEMSMVEFGDSAETKRFMASLVDGPGPALTLVLTPRGKPPVEMTFSRTGLAAAVKPLRGKCGW